MKQKCSHAHVRATWAAATAGTKAWACKTKKAKTFARPHMGTAPQREQTWRRAKKSMRGSSGMRMCKSRNTHPGMSGAKTSIAVMSINMCIGRQLEHMAKTMGTRLFLEPRAGP